MQSGILRRENRIELALLSLRSATEKTALKKDVTDNAFPVAPKP
jgi:hypothetical protein